MNNEPVKTLKDVERLLFGDAMTVIRIQLALQLAYDLGRMHALEENGASLDRIVKAVKA